MSSLLAFLSAISWGAADFLGGLATRRSGRVFSVIVLSQTAGLVGVAIAAGLIGGDLVAGDIGWAGTAGVSGAVGLVLLYRGLAVGTMSVVAPLSAIMAAVVPVSWGLITGERPSLVAMVGIPIALASIGLVTGLAIGRLERGPGLLEGIGAGIGFGTFFILIANTESAEVWTLTFARVTSVVVLLTAALIVRAPLRPGPGVLWLIVGAGLIDTGANLLFLLAERRGLLTLVAVISALYPAGTVLLARLVLHERLTRSQLLGLGVAALGIALISAG